MTVERYTLILRRRDDRRRKEDEWEGMRGQRR